MNTGRTRILALTMVAGSAISSPAMASNFSYSYLQVAGEAIVFDEDLRFANVLYEGMSGASLAGSYQFSENLYIALDSQYLENSGFGTEINTSIGRLVLGGAFAAGQGTDLVVEIGAGSIEAEACMSGLCSKEDDTGLELKGGVRHLVNPNFEINAAISYSDFGDDLDGTIIRAGGAWWLNDSSSFRVNLGLDEESNARASIGYRYTFNWSR